MARKKKARNRNLAVASNMPPLFHKLPNQEYHYSKSEVIKWLSERPELIEYIYNQAANAKEIVFNSATGKWQGVDYHD